MERIISDGAPDAIGPYIHATKSNNLVFTSGQIGLDPKSGKLAEGFDAQAKLALDNLKNILETSGSNFDHILKVTIYLDDLANFAKVNEIYKEHFNGEFPARTAFEVAKLPMDAKIEIEAIAEVK